MFNDVGMRSKNRDIYNLQIIVTIINFGSVWGNEVHKFPSLKKCVFKNIKWNEMLLYVASDWKKYQDLHTFLWL